MWVKLTDRQPPKYGEYKVKRRGRGKQIYEDQLLWNGSSFVTHGHCLTKAVNEWWEETESGEIRKDR